MYVPLFTIRKSNGPWHPFRKLCFISCTQHYLTYIIQKGKIVQKGQTFTRGVLPFVLHQTLCYFTEHKNAPGCEFFHTRYEGQKRKKPGEEQTGLFCGKYGNESWRYENEAPLFYFSLQLLLLMYPNKAIPRYCRN